MARSKRSKSRRDAVASAVDGGQEPNANEASTPSGASGTAGATEGAAGASPSRSLKVPGTEQGARLSARGRWILAGVLVLLNAPLIHRFLIRGEAEVTTTVPFREDFNAAPDLSEHWFSTGGMWRVVNGALLSPGVKNNPLWLQARLPDDVRIEFTARAHGSEGDVKVEVFGDGTDHASGYVLIHGGWNNSVSIIARLDEHGRAVTADGFAALGPRARVRVEERSRKVVVGRAHRWKIERQGGTLRWFLDGQLLLTFVDPHPLKGPGHDRFGFSSWMNDVTYDDLVITPL